MTGRRGRQSQTKVYQTESYEVFSKNLDRSKAFVRTFNQTGRVGQPSNDRKELLRGVLVLAIGSLDAFLVM